jgi:ABC-2 type transport system permease protein
MKTFITLLQREYWENRGSFAFTPIAIGGFFIAVMIFALFASETFLPQSAGNASDFRISGINISGFDFFAGFNKEFVALPLEKRQELWSAFFYGVSGLFTAVLIFVSIFYLLGALYDDRRDRSILFWKSLPVSDLMTVTSKVVVVFLVLPVLFTIAMMLTFVAIVLITTIVALLSGGGIWASIWQPAPFISVPLTILYSHIIHTLWAAPLIAWLLFVSSWTKRKPILVATIPLAAISFLELYYYRSSEFARAVWERALGWAAPIDVTSGRHLGSGSLLEEQWNIYEMSASLLTTAGMWQGLVVAAVFFAGAVIVRRYRDESL